MGRVQAMGLTCHCEKIGEALCPLHRKDVKKKPKTTYLAMTKKCRLWMLTHSAVDAVNMAAGKMHVADVDLHLAVEIQTFVQRVVSLAMLKAVER